MMSSLASEIWAAVYQKQEQIIAFAQELIRIKSITGSEAAVAQAVVNKMHELAYDEVIVDQIGNVIGMIGTGQASVLFDSHMDTVDVIDAEEWAYDPFGGEISQGRLYGRGAVDMKGALAASVYAGAIARDLKLLEGKRVYISASVMEEDYDGEPIIRLTRDNDIHPDNVVICEATDMQIGYGHRGRALIEITVNGKSAHGSKPEQGINPIYGLQHVVARIEALAARLAGQSGEHGSVAITNMRCVTASNNSVPQSASITLDRRLSIEEDFPFLEKEMAEVLEGVDGSWCICDVPGMSWRQEPILLHSYLPAWEVSVNSPLAVAAGAACQDILGDPPDYVKLGYSTNAVATAGILNIPTIVLGPGDAICAHEKDEYCPVESLLQACAVYAMLCEKIG